MELGRVYAKLGRDEEAEQQLRLASTLPVEDINAFLQRLDGEAILAGLKQRRGRRRARTWGLLLCTRRDWLSGGRLAVGASMVHALGSALRPPGWRRTHGEGRAGAHLELRVVPGRQDALAAVTPSVALGHAEP